MAAVNSQLLVQLGIRTNLTVVRYGETMSAHLQAMFKIEEEVVKVKLVDPVLPFESVHFAWLNVR